MKRDGNGVSDAAYLETVPAGILQTPKQIHEYKRTVFDFRGTPLVNIVENDVEVKAPPQQINTYEKNIS